MILFWLLAAAMVVVALIFVVPPLLGHGKRDKPSRQELNVSIFRERITDLEEDLAEGAISESQYQQARAELERDLLEDTTESTTASSPASGRWAAIGVGVAIPLLAVGIYWQIGAHHLVDGVPQQAEDSGPSVEEMITRLAQRMQEDPSDPEGWIMLGRSYSVMERFAEAAEAFGKAYELLGDQPQILADYAEALSMAAGGSMGGRPLQLIKEALRVDPENHKALWLAGIAAYQGGEKGSAVAIWRKLSRLLPPESDDLNVVKNSIAQVESELSGGASEDAGSGVSDAKLQVEVTLADTLRDKAAPDDTVFVFARAVQGPPAPLAAVRFRVRDLPLTVTLDDSQAMVADRPLSSAEQVTVSARVSKSGNPIAASGDLQGSSSPVSVVSGEPVKLTIDQVVQ